MSPAGATYCYHTACEATKKKTPGVGGGHGGRYQMSAGALAQPPMRAGHFLYFLPEPHGHGSVGPTFTPLTERPSRPAGARPAPMSAEPPWLSCQCSAGAGVGAAATRTGGACSRP